MPRMSEELYRRIKQRLLDLGISESKASMQVNGTRDLIRNIKRGRAGSLRGPNLLRLAELLCVTPDWLQDGTQDHISSEDVAATLAGNDNLKSLAKSSLEKFSGRLPGSVPEIDAKAGAGNGNVGEHEVVTLRRGESYVGHKVVSEWVFPPTFLRHELRMQPGEIMVLEVIGDSMSPTLESGDRVMVDTTYSKPTPDGIYVIEEGDGPMVKRLQLVRRSNPPEVRIISDNNHHEPYSLLLADIRIIGRVSGRITKM